MKKLFLIFLMLFLSYAEGLDNGGVIADEYLVVFKEGFSVKSRDEHVRQQRERFQQQNNDEKIIHVFDIGELIGYSAFLSQGSLALEMKNPNVKYVEPNQEMKLMSDGPTDDVVIVPNPPWGLDRIDQRQLPLDQLYHYFKSAGSGVNVYVIDTGILLQHEEFGGRAVFGTNLAGDGRDTDCNGHGTNVAGVIGGRLYGVAKNATLVAVKVMNCDGAGSTANVIAGIDYVTKQYTATRRPSVGNLSLGGGASTTLDNAVRNSISAGVSYAVAAGSSSADACQNSPARVLEALVAAATDQTDTRSSSSSYGKCIDVFAPGVSIQTAGTGSNGTTVLSGTSFSTAFVAGVVAVHLGHVPNPGTPADVKVWLDSVATPSVVKNPGTNSPNRLLYSPFA